jgi:hypothetical protein
MLQNGRESLVAVVLLAVCSLFPIASVAQTPVPQPIPVSVQNTPNVNVANTPTVSVSNTPSVNVANSPSVTLQSGASVAVTSPLDGQGNRTPIAVLDAFQPYEDSCTINFAGLQFSNCYFQSIPADKLLVIQEFDAYGYPETGVQPDYVALYYTGAFIAHYFPATHMSSAGGLDMYVSNAETRVYMLPGSQPNCGVDLSGHSSQMYTCQISGYLVDAPLNSSSNTAPAQGRQLPPAPVVRSSAAGRQASDTGR